MNINSLRGRTKIALDFSVEDMRDDSKLLLALEQAIPIHMGNKVQIEYLINYSKGNQSILDKKKDIRPEINNQIVINHAQMVTRNIAGYFMGNPIQYINGSGKDKQTSIDALNRALQYENKSAVDKQIVEVQSITGTAYRIIYNDSNYPDDIPFEDRYLDPSMTFVAYESRVSGNPLFGVTFVNATGEDGNFMGYRMYIYTQFAYYEIVKEDGVALSLDNLMSSRIPFNVGGVPIIEYPNNMWRLGDWEIAIGLMDAINSLHSGRLDDVDQVVQSLLVFINAEIDKDTYREMREEGVISLKNQTNNQSKIDSITNNLDQSGMNMFSGELEDLLYAILGIPSRNNRAGGGGDTGQAVELRDGWADLEIIARNKEVMFKSSERRTLRIILNLFNTTLDNESKLSPLDIDIKFSRNKTNNLLVKTQSYQTLLSTKTLSPADCLSIVDLVSDVAEFIGRGEEFWGDSFANKNEDVVDNVTDEVEVIE